MGAILQSAMDSLAAARPDPAHHYTAMAREALLVKALRDACAEIEQWAGYAFRVNGQSQADFERAWSTESNADAEHYFRWCELKTVAGLKLTDLSTEPAWGDE